MRNVLGRLSIFLIGLGVSWSSKGQEILVQGGFVEDSMKIGEDIHYWLSARYPENLDLVLPDTTYDFSPFEFSGKTYFPSKVVNGSVVDSAVYTLQSYEIEPVQYLELPAYVLNPTGDSTVISTSPDSVIFAELAPVVTDSTRLKTNLAYQDVPRQFNYPLMWIILGSLLLMAIVVLLVFGKKFRKMWRLRKLRKQYLAFSGQLSAAIRELKQTPNRQVAEHTISSWKHFLEDLENLPFSKYTTKEIMALDYTAELNGTLKNIDRCVYGGKVTDSIYKDFQVIEDFTQHRYQVITDQIKNG